MSMETTTQSRRTQDVEREARETWSQAKQAAERELGARKGTLTQEIDGIARALQTSADNLQAEHETAAKYARHAAQAIESVGRRIGDRSIGDLFSELQSLSREKPLLVGTTAALLGFIGSRVMRDATEASTQEDPSSQSSSTTTAGGL